ncbi:MAG: hypothetical protein HQM08_23225 [Candidatus Riflebacteria bacterium]|nr:hypothetical protein [Candidatus Riflebacteria bacterium]
MAIGYVVVNQFHFFPRRFKKNLSGVVYSGEFGGTNTGLFKLLALDRSVAEKLVYKECCLYRETLTIAREILGDSHSEKEPLYVKKGRHVFFFNKAENHPEDADASLIFGKKESGWLHSFYSYEPPSQ